MHGVDKLKTNLVFFSVILRIIKEPVSFKTKECSAYLVSQNSPCIDGQILRQCYYPTLSSVGVFPFVCNLCVSRRQGKRIAQINWSNEDPA